MKAWAALAMGLVLAGCGGGDRVANQAGYDATLAKARALAVEPLKAFEDGTDPDSDAERDLREARRLFTALIEYAPSRFSLYIGAAQIDAALDDRVSAVRMARQALVIAPARTDPAGAALVGEAHYLLALIAFREGQYGDAGKEAAVAIGLVPTSPKFRTMRASALIQLGDQKGARREIADALKAAPAYPPAERLDRLLRSADRR